MRGVRLIPGPSLGPDTFERIRGSSGTESKSLTEPANGEVRFGGIADYPP
jgi:hypothetical protein